MMELVLKERPDDRAEKYNVAALLFATKRGIDRAALLAKELYEDDPVSVGNAVIHGFGIHLQGDSRKAAALLDGRDDLHKLGNDGAAYYSLILAGCGRDEDTRVSSRPSTARHYCLLCATQLITPSECL